MKASEIPAEFVEAAKSAWGRKAHERLRSNDPVMGIDEVARTLIAAAWPLIARRVLEEAANYQGPADEGAHFTPEARNLLRVLANRAEDLAPEGRGGEGA